MTPFDSLFEKHYHGDADACAEAIMAAGKLSRYQRELYRPCILLGIWNLAGKDRQRAERAAFSAPSSAPEAIRGASPTQKAPPVPTLPDLRILLNESFSLNGRGVSVTWGEATVEQHEERMRYLARKIDGLSDTMDKHAQVVATCKAHGVTCLADLYKPKRKAA